MKRPHICSITDSPLHYVWSNHSEMFYHIQKKVTNEYNKYRWSLWELESGLVRKAVGFYRIPIGKPDDLCRTVLKIKWNLAPFAVAVCLVFVDCGGDFLFALPLITPQNMYRYIIPITVQEKSALSFQRECTRVPIWAQQTLCQGARWVALFAET